MEDQTQTPAVEGGTIQPTPGTDQTSEGQTSAGQTEMTATEAASSAPVAQPTAQTAPAGASTDDRDYPAMTMEDVLASEATEHQAVSRGDIVDGTVVFIGQEGIAVDVGAKVEGTIPLNQIAEEPVTLEEAQQMYKPGDKIEAYVVRVDLANSQIVLSKKRADQDKGWRVLERMQERDEASTLR